MNVSYIEAMSVSAIRKRDIGPTTAVISISTPNSQYPEDVTAFLGAGAVHRIEVDDLDRLPSPGRVAVFGRPTLFDREHASALWKWWRSLPSSITTLYVHCDAGISRSTAIAHALADDIGVVARVSKFAAPNQLIARIMSETRP